VITVAATGQTGQKAYYSNYGASVEIAAPGGDGQIDTMVLSTLNSGLTAPVASSYAHYQGTSMATPHVVGLVSLMFSINPSLTPAQVLTLLQQNVTPFPAGSTCTTANCGSGIANAAATLQAMQLPPPGDTTPNPFGWPTKTGVTTNTWITSEPIVLTGFDTPAPFAVDNGYLILNCAPPAAPKPPRFFGASDESVVAPSADLSSGTVSPGTSVCVKHMSSATGGATVTSTVTVGGVSGTFKSVTKSAFGFFPR
jgi:subtilisin family serine protease